jgi:aminoglycoside/choline kinase family phosphotransferase
MAEARADRIKAFLADTGWDTASRTALPGDASFRHYERLSDGARRAMLMDAPPPEDVRPFVAIARHLTALGFSAPEILAEDAEAGLLVLDDLGDDTFTRLLDGGADPAPLYELAVDLLIDLHQRPINAAVPAGLAPYDDALFIDEAALLTGWYMPAVLGAEVPPASAREYCDLWRIALSKARDVPETLVLRDYHVDNLMRVAGRDALAACGLLDFQDAVRGPVTYDLVSLLEDARRDVDAGLAARLRARYLDAFPGLDEDEFTRSMAILGAQRHAKVIGIFTRLLVRDGKQAYLRHIPRVWRLLEASCRHPALSAIAAWLDIHLPAAARVVPEAGDRP